MVLIQCHGKSKAMQCRYIIRLHDYYSFVCVHALVLLFILSPILLSMNSHSDYDTIDGRIAGYRCPYPDIFQRSIKSHRVHEFCQTHLVVETKMVDKLYKTFYCFHAFLNASD